MFAQVKSFWQDESGASAIEYGLIAGLIALAIVIAVGNVGTKLEGLFSDIESKIPAEAAGGA